MRGGSERGFAIRVPSSAVQRSSEDIISQRDFYVARKPTTKRLCNRSRDDPAVPADVADHRGESALSGKPAGRGGGRAEEERRRKSPWRLLNTRPFWRTF